MKIRFLGTNGWYDSGSGETPCILIDSQEAYVVLDAGNALRKLDRHIKNSKPVFLFLSHFHLDHVFGLHTLMKFGFPQGIAIVGQPGTKKFLETLMAGPFTAPLGSVGKKFPLKILELKEGMNDLGAFRVEALPLIHADPCWGFTFFLEGKKVAYCTDTGQCENISRLAKDADLLITECSWLSHHESEWPHLSPETAADAALKSGASRLVLTHFDARNYPDMQSRLEAEARARKIFPDTMAAEDGMEISL